MKKKKKNLRKRECLLATRRRNRSGRVERLTENQMRIDCQFHACGYGRSGQKRNEVRNVWKNGTEPLRMTPSRRSSTSGSRLLNRFQSSVQESETVRRRRMVRACS